MQWYETYVLRTNPCLNLFCLFANFCALTCSKALSNYLSSIKQIFQLTWLLQQLLILESEEPRCMRVLSTIALSKRKHTLWYVSNIHMRNAISFASQFFQIIKIVWNVSMQCQFLYVPVPRGPAIVRQLEHYRWRHSSDSKYLASSKLVYLQLEGKH